ncbi:MAG: GatB/YqeY domain-containing protein [Candidatus Vogelbacteria bacterium]|nr:GatB/YqeY domain-containing protein [Candidatus Vogelbacteria bacterium]
MLHEEIEGEIKKAMLAHDELKLNVMRSIVAAFTNELVSLKRKPQDTLNDNECLNVIKRLVRQRRDSIDQFTKGGRQDLVESEVAEMKIIETYLPATMSREEIKKVAIQMKDKLTVTDKSKAGLFVGSLIKELKGKADGADVKAVVDELLS